MCPRMGSEVAFRRRTAGNSLIRPETGLGEVEEGRVLSYHPKGLFGRSYASHGLGGIMTTPGRFRTTHLNWATAGCPNAVGGTTPS